MPTTKGMKPGGFYNAHSDAQRAAIDAFLPWLVETVAELPVSKGSDSPLVMLDIGSSQGSNAIHVTHRLVEAVRRHTRRPPGFSSATCPPTISTRSLPTCSPMEPRHSPSTLFSRAPWRAAVTSRSCRQAAFTLPRHSTWSAGMILCLMRGFPTSSSPTDQNIRASARR